MRPLLRPACGCLLGCSCRVRRCRHRPQPHRCTSSQTWPASSALKAPSSASHPHTSPLTSGGRGKRPCLPACLPCHACVGRLGGWLEGACACACACRRRCYEDAAAFWSLLTSLVPGVLVPRKDTAPFWVGRHRLPAVHAAAGPAPTHLPAAGPWLGLTAPRNTTTRCRPWPAGCPPAVLQDAGHGRQGKSAEEAGLHAVDGCQAGRGCGRPRLRAQTRMPACTRPQVPAVVRLAREALDRGECVVIGL